MERTFDVVVVGLGAGEALRFTAARNEVQSSFVKYDLQLRSPRRPAKPTLARLQRSNMSTRPFARPHLFIAQRRHGVDPHRPTRRNVSRGQRDGQKKSCDTDKG
ncbi:MAG: hypothetical protein JWQ42_5098 [Edaphobacter sp.]|nr:hypothetical protein [Edaphobacter sp.]